MDRSTYDTTVGWGSYSESSTGVPGFHKLKKLGQHLPVNNYDWYRIDGKSPYSDTYNGARTERQARGYSTFDDAVQFGTLSPTTGGSASVQTMSNMIAIVQNRLLGKIRGQDIDLGVALGESRETAAFVTSAMVKTAKSYRQLRRGDVSGALLTLTGRKNRNWRDIPGAASNTWLAYTYGLRPLLADVYGACEALDKRNKPYVDVKTVRSGATQHVEAEVHSYGIYHNRVAGSITARGQISFRVSNPLLKVIDSVGLTNPLSVAWELVPFSFVVDWFVPVGNMIQGIAPPQGVDFVDGWISCKCSGVSRAWTTIPSPQPGWYTTAEATEVRKYRRKLTSFPRYHLVVPDFSLSKLQVASGLALLWQVLAEGSSKRR